MSLSLEGPPSVIGGGATFTHPAERPTVADLSRERSPRIEVVINWPQMDTLYTASRPQVARSAHWWSFRLVSTGGWPFRLSSESKAREHIRGGKAGYAKITVLRVRSLVKKAEARRTRSNRGIRHLDSFLAVDVSCDDVAYSRSGDYVPILTSSAWPTKLGKRWRKIIWWPVEVAHLDVRVAGWGAHPTVDVVTPAPVLGKGASQPDFYLVVVGVCARGPVPPNHDLHELIAAPISSHKCCGIRVWGRKGSRLRSER